MKINANGVELHVETMGEGDALLLIMGLGCQLVFWPEAFCQRLVARGFRVIRFDNRDVGLSQKWAEHGVPDARRNMLRWMLGLKVSAPYTLNEMAEDARGVLDALGIERAHVAGVSMGGMIAQTMAIRFPERMKSLTSIMSMTGAKRHAISRPDATRALMLPPGRTREEAIERSVQVFRIIGSPAPWGNDAAVRERATMAYDRCFHPEGFARQYAAILASGDRTKALRGVRVPSLVIHGKSDPLILATAGRATAEAIPGARYLEIEGMGHDMPEPAWPRIIDAMGELAKLPRRRPAAMPSERDAMA